QCVQACPMGLNPTLLAASVENEDMDDLLKNGLMDCMECGACAFICPSQRQLVHWIAVGKMRVKR
nr:4Fe-4S dicluster domain-containing protein [Candidatus Sumerlaeota bacterium]